MPDGAVYVGRPSKWGNPWVIAPGFDAQACVENYAAYMERHQEFYPLHELHGKDLACWCPLDHPCHADVLLELANR